MSNRDDDVLPASYKYAWFPKSELPLEDFLRKFKPSMVQNDGTKPWIWVRGPEPSKEDRGKEEAIAEGKNLLKEVIEKVENIKNDGSIPVRSNKKNRCKKQEGRSRAGASRSNRTTEGNLHEIWLRLRKMAHLRTR